MHGGVLLFVNLHTFACNFTKSNTRPLVLFTVFKLYKWYQIMQCILNDVLFLLKKAIAIDNTEQKK